MSSVQRADPLARSVALIALIAISAAALLGWREFSQWLEDLRSAPGEEAVRVLLLALRLLICGMGIGLMLFAFHL